MSEPCELLLHERAYVEAFLKGHESAEDAANLAGFDQTPTP